MTPEPLATRSTSQNGPASHERPQNELLGEGVTFTQEIEKDDMNRETATIRHVKTTDAARIDDLLNSALEQLIPTALALNHGLRVTRIGPGEYTVETASDVTCGYTVCE